MQMSVAMGTNERRERERQELRQKILDAARELLLQKGYEALTMREIAARIEYSATALYGHFADKETLVRELCRRDFFAFAQRFLDLATVTDPVERLCRAGLVYLDFAKQYPAHYRFMFMAEIPASIPEEGERENPAQNAYAFLRLLIGDLAKADLLRADHADVDLVAQTIWGLVHGTAALEIMLYRGDPWVDMRAYEERVGATLELAACGFLRDPKPALASVHKVLAERAASRKTAGKKRK